MKTFRRSGAHASVMPRLPKWCDEASYAHWNPESSEVPSWQDAYDHLVREGRLSRVECPSPDHQAQWFRPPRRLNPLIGHNLVPVRRS
ncbi:MAG: hypothetical protein DMG62_16220 [Acidobacteria bacterium]|nr:MAG: hypothetical protein DMG62_16220 [Acidobacteriota bacterium]